MKIKTKWIVLAAIAAAVVLYLVFGWSRSGQPQHFTAKVERGEVDDVVEATGTINAVITVQVGSQVSGTIAKLNADFNSRVHKGDIVALIDPALFQGALLQTKADLENSRANLVAAKANLEKTKASLVQVKADYDRTVELTKEGVFTQQQQDLAKANYDSAVATVNGTAANVTQAEAEVKLKEAAVDVAQTNLNYTVIRSPIDGTVVARNVDVGQTVAASLQAPTIFTIAQDLTKMQVYTKTDESDVGNIKKGREVTFKVDAFPKDTFHGVVSQVRMNATTVQNVVTYDTIIDFNNPDLKLFPGMTAYVTIPVATSRDTLKLPNTALRYRPPFSSEEVLALYQQYGIEAGGKKLASDEVAAAERTPPSQSPASSAQRQSRTETAIVWKLHPDNSLEPVKVALGITDHSYTEVVSVLKGQLKEGDGLVIRSVVPKSTAPGAQPVRR
ncbi:MAG TPA: efflux RND transporter periplasmic adaptor subunit [Candidatus Acidoferrum sp.]|nr:efflux RND transporter periplasmic adaptor subunit [Candidatus Acidoferrum sp.]